MLSDYLLKLKQYLQQQAGPFIQRFSRNSYRWSGEGLEPLGALPGLPAGGCLLPRAQLFFTRLDLNGVPQRQRLEAAMLELEQKAPFDRPRGWVVWEEERACVWYWPQSLEQLASSASSSGLGLDFLPETALWPPLSAGSFRWVEAPELELYLLQYQHPKQGLYEKRYSKSLHLEDVLAWLVRHGWQPNGKQADLTPSPPPLAADGPGPSGQSLNPSVSTLEHKVFPGLALFLIFIVLVYSFALGRAWWAAGRAQEAQQALHLEVQAIVEQRNRASRLRTENLQLAAIRQPSQLVLAAALAKHLEADNTRLVRWSYRNQRLELTWQIPEQARIPEATDIIRRLEALAAFSQVQAQVNERVVEISLDVDPEQLSRAEGGVDSA